jgi:ceramide glucosyltransferase
MWGRLLLALWSGAGLAWWLLAWRLAAAARKKSLSVPLPPPVAEDAPFLSVFKPLPPLAAGAAFAGEGLASFAAQLDGRSEMLLGIDEADCERLAPLIERLRRDHPAAALKVVVRPSGTRSSAANPKIAWQRLLAREAAGELWLWSDADIIAPPGFLRAARAEFARGNAAMVTFPYVVREIPAAPALFDALFVNVEFHPGVLLMGRLGTVDFGLGAGMLFRRDDFLAGVDWERLGASLADDFVLGQALRPVRLGAATLVTRADPAGWKEALDHYLRWHKTIRWCRPFGFAAQAVLLPVLGWIAAIVLQPRNPLAWAGLLGMVAAEVCFAEGLCREAGCRLGLRDMAAAVVWSLGRGFVWLFCWLPWPVVWRRRVWHRARLELPRAEV